MGDDHFGQQPVEIASSWSSRSTRRPKAAIDTVFIQSIGKHVWDLTPAARE